MSVPDKPVVLCFSGHDPGGGAGIQADIEAIGAQGAFAATVVTCLTEQDSRQVYAVHSVSPELIRQQAQRLFADYRIAAIKIGLLGNADSAYSILELLREQPPVPLILDPVLASGAGSPLAQAQWLRPLFARCTLLTPNREEARRLTGKNDLESAAQQLMNAGCTAVLITGADESEQGRVTHSLYHQHGVRHWQWQKLPGQYHGSGCTLASAIAAQIALGQSLELACHLAQTYTYASLQRAIHPGKGQFIPNRL